MLAKALRSPGAANALEIALLNELAAQDRHIRGCVDGYLIQVLDGGELDRTSAASFASCGPWYGMQAPHATADALQRKTADSRLTFASEGVA